MAEELSFAEKIKTIQFAPSGLSSRNKIGKGVYIPPERGKRSMGVLIPSFGMVEQAELDYLTEAAFAEHRGLSQDVQVTEKVEIERRPDGTAVFNKE